MALPLSSPTSLAPLLPNIPPLPHTHISTRKCGLKLVLKVIMRYWRWSLITLACYDFIRAPGGAAGRGEMAALHNRPKHRAFTDLLPRHIGGQHASNVVNLRHRPTRR